MNHKTNKKILIPDYICEVILHPLIDLDYELITYQVDNNFKLNLISFKSYKETSANFCL